MGSPSRGVQAEGRRGVHAEGFRHRVGGMSCRGFRQWLQSVGRVVYAVGEAWWGWGQEYGEFMDAQVKHTVKQSVFEKKISRFSCPLDLPSEGRMRLPLSAGGGGMQPPPLPCLDSGR